jgi:hypothetical protein
VSQPLLYGAEAFCAYAFLHLREVGLSWYFVVVSAGGTHFFVSSEAFD